MTSNPQWNSQPQPMIPLDFKFDGDALTYFGISILARLVSMVTLGFGLPWGICMIHRWKAEHTTINGHRIHFSGTGAGLFGNWIKWLLLCIITLGIYSFWVVPRLQKWITEHNHCAIAFPAPQFDLH